MPDQITPMMESRELSGAQAPEGTEGVAAAADPVLGLATGETRGAVAAGKRPEGMAYLNRRPDQCAWPLGNFGEAPPELKRVCGKPALPPLNPDRRAPLQYCDDHIDRATGKPPGTTAALRRQRPRSGNLT